MKNKNLLLGLGFDAQDEHKRITRGKNFYILGGCKQTHQSMQENCVKFNEELNKRRKNLNQISRCEFYDIAHKIGLKTAEHKERKDKDG
ncbi:MAG: hypothetical protein HQ595_02645 [Candidatus Omnitrophica bacterium]|nr:hypothetical protein [Candidatus Omnitrophota bacterium]